MDLQIDSGETHLWSDVLHYSWLADKVKNEWDYSTYVRTILIFGCIVIEKKLAEYSGCMNVGYSIKKNINNYNLKNKLDRIDWTSSWGKMYSELLAKRKEIVHQKGDKVKKHFKKDSHKKLINHLCSILDGIHFHYKSADRKFWIEQQSEDYKNSGDRAFLSYILDLNPEEKRVRLNYVFEGKSRNYGEVPLSYSEEKYKEMTRLVKGPISETNIELDGEIVKSENWFSRGC